MEKVQVNFTVNGSPVSLMVDPNARLLDVIREDLRLTGTKEGCAVGECGACTVIVDGKAVTACLILAASMEGKNLITIEGVAKDGVLDPVQEAILRNHALQCGFCTPGFVMSAKALLDANPYATREEILTAISGNLCRCTGYKQLADAIFEAAQEYQKVKEGVSHV